MALVTAAVLMLGVVGCTGSGTTSAAGRTPPQRSSAPSSAAAAAAIPYSLLTHCGIDEARIGSRYLEADTPLSGGDYNAPPGWGTPFQAGTMTFLSSTRAVFRDDRGHQVFFRVRPGATAF